MVCLVQYNFTGSLINVRGKLEEPRVRQPGADTLTGQSGWETGGGGGGGEGGDGGDGGCVGEKVPDLKNGRGMPCGE